MTIQEAMRNNKTEYIKQYILAGNDLHVVDTEFGERTLFNYSIQYGNTELVEMMLNLGVNKNYKTERCHAPIMTALYYNKPVIFEMLLKAGVDISEEYLGLDIEYMIKNSCLFGIQEIFNIWKNNLVLS